MSLAVSGWLLCEVVARVAVPMPDARVLGAFLGRQGVGLLGLYDRLVGGAMSSGSVLGLGLMPYLSARVFRLLARVVSPTIARLERSADGRRILSRWTMRLTAGLSVVQAYGFARFTQALPGAVAQPGVAYTLQTVAALSAVAVFMGWIAEQVTADDVDARREEPSLLSEAPPDVYRAAVQRVVTPLPSISGDHPRGAS